MKDFKFQYRGYTVRINESNHAGLKNCTIWHWEVDGTIFDIDAHDTELQAILAAIDFLWLNFIPDDIKRHENEAPIRAQDILKKFGIAR